MVVIGAKRDAWQSFSGARWRGTVDVRDFILNNVTAYNDDHTFLTSPTAGAHPRRGGELLIGPRADPAPKDPIAKSLPTAPAVAGPSSPSLAAGRTGIVTGLPGGQATGEVIGDYRRVALYGVDTLIAFKRADRAKLGADELDQQIWALDELANRAAGYGCDLRRRAETGQEAVQWIYFAYLAATEGTDYAGSTRSLGRISTFLDIFLQRDLAEGLLSEQQAQELIDELVSKVRTTRFAPAAELGGVSETIGGMAVGGRSLVTRTSFRFLQTLYNLGPAPEPNLTVLWSTRLPTPFKRFCAQVSVDTNSIQYVSDDLLRPRFGDDTAITGSLSATRIGKSAQLPGGRVDLAKALLYAINGGRDEVSGDQVSPAAPPLTSDVLDYGQVRERLDQVLDWLARTCTDAFDVIPSRADPDDAGRLRRALHDFPVRCTPVCGLSGLSVAVDSLLAIRSARVRPIRDDAGLVFGFTTDGEFPTYGNGDPDADRLAAELVHAFRQKLHLPHLGHSPRSDPGPQPCPRTGWAPPVLTVTANGLDGQGTGSTPDGRRAGEPFALGAGPMNGRDTHGLLMAALSAAMINYDDALGGIGLTTSTIPPALGRNRLERVDALVGVLDTFFAARGFHLDVNILDRATLLDAMDHPENYPSLTVRVGGYAVLFVGLSREQQQNVVDRSFHRTAAAPVAAASTGANDDGSGEPGEPGGAGGSGKSGESGESGGSGMTVST